MLWKILLLDTFSNSEIYVEAPKISKAIEILRSKIKEEQIKSIELITTYPVLR